MYSRDILNSIGCDKLSLHDGHCRLNNGDWYHGWYFIYKTEFRPVTKRLHDLPFSEWVSEGKKFIEEVEKEK
jgi:hypothetical protein